MLPNCKFMLHFCAQCTHIDIPIPEPYQNNSNVIPTISFNVYQQIPRCTVNGRSPFDKINIVNFVSLPQIQL